MTEIPITVNILSTPDLRVFQVEKWSRLLTWGFSPHLALRTLPVIVTAGSDNRYKESEQHGLSHYRCLLLVGKVMKLAWRSSFYRMSTERWFLDMYKRKKMPGQKCKINLQMCLCLISTQYPEAPLMNYFRLQRVMAFVIVNLDMCLVRLFTKHVCLGFCTPCLLHNRCQSVGFGTQVLDHPRTKPAQEGLTEKLSICTHQAPVFKCHHPEQLWSEQNFLLLYISRACLILGSFQKFPC